MSKNGVEISYFNDPKLLKQLFEEGGEDYDTLNQLFFHQCKQGDVKTIELLLKLGADINYSNEDEHQMTPLHMACLGGRKENVKLLLKKGANINRTDFYGHNPLYYACETNNLKLMELFLRKGAKYNAWIRYYSVLKNIEKKIAKERVRNILLCTRKFCPDSPFSKERLPLDVFKLIFFKCDFILNPPKGRGKV